MKSGAFWGFVLVLIAAISFSTAGLFTRVVTTDIPATLFWRSLFGALFVFAIHVAVSGFRLKNNYLKFTKHEWITASVSAVATIFFISSFYYTSIANVAFVYGAAPLATALIAWLLLREKPTKATMMDATLALIGVGVLVWGGQSFSDFLGLGLAGAMTVFMASISVLMKLFPNQQPAKTTYLCGILVALMTSVGALGAELGENDMMWLAIYGLVNVGLGFGLYVLGATKISPTSATLISMLEIPLAAIWAAWLFGEAVTTPMYIGGGIVIAAAVIHTLKPS